MIKQTCRDVLSLFYPAVCPGCEGPLETGASGLCWECLSSSFLLQEPFCLCCGTPVSGEIQHAYVCHTCSSSKRYFDMVRSAARYEGPVKESVQKLKYTQALWAAEGLSELMLASLRTHWPDLPFDFVVPVPLYPARERERGYNQSAILARLVAKKMGCRLDLKVLRRNRPTRTQTRLTAARRRANVRGAFEAKISAMHGADFRVLLVDDVVTTGATANECAKVLIRAGAQRVSVLAAAHG